MGRSRDLENRRVRGRRNVGTVGDAAKVEVQSRELEA